MGDKDDTVELRNSTALADRIRAAGGRVELKVYPGVGHIGIVLGFSTLFPRSFAGVGGHHAFHRRHTGRAARDQLTVGLWRRGAAGLYPGAWQTRPHW